MKTLLPLFIVLLVCIAGCDPFSDDSLPPATALIEKPFNNTALTVGVSHELKVRINTAVSIDSVGVQMRPRIEGSVPSEIINLAESFSVEPDTPTAFTLDTSFLLDEIKDMGVSDYMLSLEIYLADGRTSLSQNAIAVEVIFDAGEE